MREGRRSRVRAVSTDEGAHFEVGIDSFKRMFFQAPCLAGGDVLGCELLDEAQVAPPVGGVGHDEDAFVIVIGHVDAIFHHVAHCAVGHREVYVVAALSGEGEV